MGFSKEQLLARLQELQIDYSQHEHPVVLTVEAQAKYVGDLGGGLSKNLFLKDKKNRLYIVSALVNTKVDLKVLSTRLGLGKGGLRMAPEEALGEVLQVPLGCVTPFALVNESARHVALLLDQGFKSQEYCFFHPLSNDMSISLNVSGLDKFLKSVGRDPTYVDLEASPSVGKDQPPDLAALVPTSSTVFSDPSENATSTNCSVSSSGANTAKVTGNKNSVIPNASYDPDHNADGPCGQLVLTMLNLEANPSKPSSSVKNAKDKAVKSANPSASTTNVEAFVESILDKTSQLLLKEITEETIKEHGGQLGTVVSNIIRSRLSSDLNSTTMTFKNTAYTEGFHAGIHSSPRQSF
ncbi:hypothetical protein FEM48_Zijuj06G0126000 [Ziziphus jujuba var. spinosa]|uniref:YbaK/aminoacyl-tRNA synthetase-associated domain-containing protein n=1 Tax=Ziziphus jujuba var. spinosa TaxID=714518 RepID=A0A978V9B6_ZIZJJ|nr:hypothetical protein FEM48_Zijuj06G0126000 [Ziziphus jujuba var. spinosa]